jgi:hypothetical protein
MVPAALAAFFKEQRMAVNVAVAEGTQALAEFVEFYDQVYRDRRARWPVAREFAMSFLTGDSPFAQGRTIQPFVVHDKGRMLARAAAVVDERYNRHWRERLGHIIMFEALPDTMEATKLLMDTACGWLEDHRMQAARTGFGPLDLPFVIDDYESLPPHIGRHTPYYYHRLLKDAGFESEQGWVDYKIKIQPELIERWERALEAARQSGYEILPLKDVSVTHRLRDLTNIWRAAFNAHWGFVPFAEDEVAVMVKGSIPAGLLDTSVLAYRDGVPVGFAFAVPEVTATAVLAPGRLLKQSEKLNTLTIGVRESDRGRGVNLAMASYTYLELVRRGAKYLSYTLVLDDNWPSRRTAEKLGAFVCANYMVYRRNFRR